MVRAKTMTVDGEWSTVGTANIDRLSLAGNFEINMEVYAKSFAKAMEHIFEMDLDNSHDWPAVGSAQLHRVDDREGTAATRAAHIEKEMHMGFLSDELLATIHGRAARYGREATPSRMRTSTIYGQPAISPRCPPGWVGLA